MTGRYRYGVLAERIAAEYMESKGFKLLFNRYKTRYGELDLIVNNANNIVFVEVKARKKFYSSDLSAVITTRQKVRNYNAAEFFLSEYVCYQLLECRFDLVVVNDETIFKHIENIYA